MIRTVRLPQGEDLPHSPDGLTILPFTNEASLFLRHRSSPLAIEIRQSRLRATPRTFVPHVLALSATVTRAPSPALNEQVPMSRGTLEPTATISVKDLEAPVTPEENKAAISIQVAYRGALKRRALKRQAAPPKGGRVKLWYGRCVDARKHLQGPGTYLLYFLGPLVHVLIWADDMVRLLRDRKDRVKKEFRPADHTQIEELMDRLAVCE